MYGGKCCTITTGGPSTGSARAIVSTATVPPVDAPIATTRHSGRARLSLLARRVGAWVGAADGALDGARTASRDSAASLRRVLAAARTAAVRSAAICGTDLASVGLFTTATAPASSAH